MVRRRALAGLAAALRPAGRNGAASAAVMFLSVAAAGPAAAQQQAMCPDPPGNPAAGNRVLCTEDANSSDNIDIRVDGFDITAAVRSQHGVAGQHYGNGDIDIRVTGGSFETAGQNAVGVRGQSYGAGYIILDIRDAAIVTRGLLADGVLGWNYGAGSDGVIDISLSGRASVATRGDQAVERGDRCAGARDRRVRREAGAVNGPGG